MKKLLIATGNTHKTEEIAAMLGRGWEVTDLRQHPSLPTPEETGSTFAENAIIKALAASQALPGIMVLADDSGLEVDALDGAPGVYSARYAGIGATDADNRDKLKAALSELLQIEKAPFTGRFRCCMALSQGPEVLATFDGAVEGHLLLQEEGARGFGYDPLFVPDGYEHSFGVLPTAVKNQLSHRACALQKLVAWLQERELMPIS